MSDKMSREIRSVSYLNNETFRNYWAPTTDCFDAMICECGYEYCDPGHYWGPSKKCYHSIHYILSGQGILQVGDKTYYLTAGDGFYLPPDQTVYYCADMQDPWEYRWVGYLGGKVNIIMKELSFPSNPVFNYTRDSFFKDNLQQIYDYSLLQVSDSIKECLMLGHLYFFFAGLLQRFREGEVRNNLSGKEYVTKAISLIEENYMNGYTVGNIAKELGLTRSYLYKLFIRHQGISPMSYIEKYRFTRACELFRTCNVMVSDVARAVGYDDQYYFSRKFREVVGVSPKEYQKHHQKKINTDQSGVERE